VQTDKIPYRDEKGNIIGVIGFSIDITERKRAEKALQASERKLRSLATQLLTVQEDERKRISRGLHDELGHALLTLKLDLRAIEKQLLPKQRALSEEVESLLEYIDEVIDNVRRLYLGLSPGDLEDLGLTTALESLINEFSRHHREIEWSIDIDNIDALFPIKYQTAIYRIFQEILTNIGKYAAPTHVSVIIKIRQKRAVFEVEDNGKGFNYIDFVNNSSKGGMGLIAMEERIRMMDGFFKIWSQENRGTKINFTIPISYGGREIEPLYPDPG
jgi:signal transduction histidine kinase